MSDKVIKDQYGTEIAIGDLVVTNGKVGIVSKFNAHGSVNVNVPYTRNIQAWEWGAPKVENTYRRAKRDERGNYIRSNDPGSYWVYEDYTVMEKDTRKVGEAPGIHTVVRQTTYDLTVLRKIDGTLPSPFGDAIERHKILFPEKENASE